MMELMVGRSMIGIIGNTPLVAFRTDEINDATIFVKLESYNPTGSIKDRACIHMINYAVMTGALTPGSTLLDSSSGNMACALAYYGKILGYPVKVICNSKLTEDKKQFIHYFGADLEVFGDLTIDGNRRCKQLAGLDQKYFFMDQLHNPGNPIASYETLAPEIFHEIPDVAAIVGSMGSGGSMCGAARYFSETKSDTRIFTTQAASGTKIPGTGAFDDGDYITPFVSELLSSPVHQESFYVDQVQAQQRTLQLADQGIFAGFQAGGVLHATISAINKYNIKGNVVMIIGDSGWKNMDKLKCAR